MTKDHKEAFVAALKAALTGRGAQAQLARDSQVSPSYINNILTGRGCGTETIRRMLAEALGFPGAGYEDFLERGRRLLSGAALPEKAAPADPSSAALNTLDKNDFVYIPKVEARLSAGGGSLEDSSLVLDSFAFKREWISRQGRLRNLVLMDVRGDSMEPVINNGDMVLLDLAAVEPREGKIFGVAFDEAVYLKRIFTGPGELILRSENKLYPDIAIDLRDEARREALRIIGRAIWWCHAENA